MKPRFRIMFRTLGHGREVVDTFKTRKEAERALLEYRMAFGTAIEGGALLWLEDTRDNVVKLAM